MQGNHVIVTQLNKILRNEMTAISQYFLHARVLKNWGFRKLGEHEYKESIDEMKHADNILERILFLEGLPNLQDLGKLLVGETVPEILTNDLTLEKVARGDLIIAVTTCEQNADYVSRSLLQEILDETEAHVDHLETQVRLIGSLGLQNYLRDQV